LKTKTQQSETYQLQEVINETILPCRVLAFEYGIDLEVINDFASFLTIIGDVSTQKRLLGLILTNTIKYSKASKIIFTTRQLLQSDKNVLVEFSLVDNGAARKLSSESFGYFRSLVTAKALIEQLGGKSELVALSGFDTTLKFIIKFEWQKIFSTQPAKDLHYSKKLEGKKILVAEDNEVNQKVIRQILHKQGVIADFVSNGKDAVNAFEKNAGMYDLILMDLQMPYMDGFQAAHYIRKKLCSSVPIVALTTGSADANYAKCIEAGMNHFIKKPFTETELLMAVDKFLEVRYMAVC
jgi:CheY-like chemotaxis protein